ncbi:MAG: SdrD B-like domain-containing protein, partial [Thiohalobacterales bacterium]|nr:SdrD B-like domain-containing protein [Thiohalobacterales bacterium]
TASAFLTGGRFLDFRTSVGGTLSFRDVSSVDGITVDDSRETELSFYTTRRMRVGAARVQLSIAELRSGPAHGHLAGITWDQRWELRGDMDISSSVGFDTERGTGNDENRFTAGVLLNRDLGRDIRWDASLNWSHVSRDVAGTNGDSINAGFSLLWRFMPQWEAMLRASFNEASQAASSGLVGSDFTEREKTLLLSIRHARATGRPFERFGSDSGAKGYGVIEGVVFYDDNHDGMRQASEKPAAGVYVYLDGRYAQTTDRDGRYEFTPVFAGEHTISIMLEDIPLPWGLDDESPRRVNVDVRGRTTASFPLVRFDE